MKTRYQKEKHAILAYHKKRREQVKMFIKVADLYERGKLNPLEVVALLSRIRDYTISMSDL